MKIKDIRGREILDSRGLPTCEADVILEDGTIGRASVPSGASTGLHEALELRDNDKTRYFGKGVLKAVNNINTIIKKNLINMDPSLQAEIDAKLIEIDGTENKSNLGANAILAVSLATLDATSKALNIPIYKCLGRTPYNILPVPLMNILNGGAHANNNLDIQEIMIIPVGASTFNEALRYGVEIFYNLKKICQKRGFATTVGDEGGFAPNVKSNEEALKMVLEAINESGYSPKKDVKLALDCAASTFYSNGLYQLKADNLKLNSSEFVDYLENLVNNYPIISIEDGMHEEDVEGWVSLTKKLSSRIQLVGDDVFVTNEKKLNKGIELGIANSILIKVNQIGTLTETIKTIDLAKSNAYSTIMSHRSGETENSIIADLAVGLNCGQIKTGSLSRSDRLAKYNQLLRIEEDLGAQAIYNPCDVFVKYLI